MPQSRAAYSKRSATANYDSYHDYSPLCSSVCFTSGSFSAFCFLVYTLDTHTSLALLRTSLSRQPVHGRFHFGPGVYTKKDGK
jgi:hypothetical protein